MTASVTREDIQTGFERLDLIGKRVVVHASLRSFGHVVGGVDALVAEMIHCFETILAPAFCWDSNAPPLPHDRPAQNGCDYAFYGNWSKALTPFVVERAGVERSMGIVSRTLVALPQSRRSNHPWHSWVAYGLRADELVKDHPWETTNLPLERLADVGGELALIGVNLSSCTAIHIAEEKVGRRPFIRWMRDRNGEVKRVRASGCAKGFHRLMPYCQDLFSEAYVGNSRILSTSLEPFVDRTARIIEANPELTRCSADCIRCRDAIRGGPAVGD
jgi:aminoglycoside 3-N-acetyltransferase